MPFFSIQDWFRNKQVTEQVVRPQLYSWFSLLPFKKKKKELPEAMELHFGQASYFSFIVKENVPNSDSCAVCH